MNSNLDRTFKKYSFAILAQSEAKANKLGKLLGSKAHVQIFDAIEELEPVLIRDRTKVLICVQEGYELDELTQFLKEVRTAKSELILVWTIGDTLLPLSDGFSPTSVTPADFLKPIYFSLLVYEDLHASA